MTFKHKLSRRLALLRDVVLFSGVCAVAACDLQQLLGLLSPVASVTVSPATASVAVGQTVALAATPKDSMGTALYARVVTWASSAPAVATVSSSGLVTGVAAGAATITATSEGRSGTAGVTVTVTTVPVASVTVSPATAGVVVGQAMPLVATPKDASGAPLSGRGVTWASSAPAVATVTGTGLVTGVAAGAATITATSEGQSGNAAITVTAPTAPGCFASAGAWQNSSIPSQTGAFEIQFDATPKNANMDGVVGLSNGAAAAFTNLAASVRFNAAGTIDARNGAVFAAGVAIPYSAGTTYHFRLDVNIPSHSYDIYVTPAGSSEQRLGGGFAFRTEQATVSVLNNLGVLANVGTGSSSLTACNVAVSPWTPPPVASVTVAPASASIGVGAVQQFTATLKDASGNTLTGRPVTWESSSPTIAGVSGSGLVTGLLAGTATITATSEGQSGSATLTVSVAPPGGVTLLAESFDDANLTARGWYDGGAATISTTEFHGGTGSIEARFLAAAVKSSWSAKRHLFTPSPTVYVSFWVKYSTNWVGSGKPYHPHEFVILSDLDADWDGLSNNFLTAYIEQVYNGGGRPQLALQDSKNVNLSLGTPPNNLVGVTEDRSVSGCNGHTESSGVDVWNCFNMPPWYSAKEYHAAAVAFQPTPGPGYKADWNHVEAYFQMNSVVGGIGQTDGIVRYWFNGVLVIERTNVLLRTGAHPTLKFKQIVLSPYIGDGSPVDQTVWYDDLMVATARP